MTKKLEDKEYSKAEVEELIEQSIWIERCRGILNKAWQRALAVRYEQDKTLTLPLMFRQIIGEQTPEDKKTIENPETEKNTISMIAVAKEWARQAGDPKEEIDAWKKLDEIVAGKTE